MDNPMSAEESFADRRKLFKDIWEAAMHMDNKDKNIINKPKIIKTLRLDEIDRSVAGKRKKQRIKNLRSICNKLLNFCDVQESSDMYYEQMLKQNEGGSKKETAESSINSRVKFLKPTRKPKHKIRKSKSLSPNKNSATKNIVSNQIVNTVEFGYVKSRNTQLKINASFTSMKTNKLDSKNIQEPSLDLIPKSINPEKINYVKKLRELRKDKIKTRPKYVITPVKRVNRQYVPIIRVNIE